MPAKDHAVARLSSLLVARDSGGASTTLSNAEAVGSTAIEVASGTGIANGEMFRVGSGETMELVRVTAGGGTSNLTIAQGLVYAHSAGEPFVEQAAYDLGSVLADDGVVPEWNGQSQDIFVADKRLVYTKLLGYVDFGLRWTFPFWSLEALCVATGTPWSKISGAGTQADPFQIAFDGNDFNTEQNSSVIATAVKENGGFFRVEAWGCDADYTGIQSQLALGQPANFACRLVSAAGGAAYDVNHSYAIDTSKRTDKGATWAQLTEVGFFSASGASSTVAGAAITVGDNQFDVTSGTGFAAGDWIKINTGDLAEYHQIETVATNTITTRTRTLRGHAIGTAVVEQVQTQFGGVAEAGVQFTIGGAVEPRRLATRRQSIGLRSGNAAVTFGFGVIDYTLLNLARGLGLDTAGVAGNRLPISEIGAVQIDGIYLKGKRQDTKTVQITSWGNTLDNANTALRLANQGESVIPFLMSPASGVCIAIW